MQWPVVVQIFMLKYCISMIFFNVGYGISIRKYEYFGNIGMLSSMKTAWICLLLVAEGKGPLYSRAVYYKHVSLPSS